jgi:hypothetical protein
MAAEPKISVTRVAAWKDQTREERIRTLLYNDWPPSPFDWAEAFREGGGPKHSGVQKVAPRKQPRTVSV